MEGLRRYDLFGDSHGWRRPGTEMFIEPGVSYQQGGHTFTFNVPLGYYYNRRPNPYTGNPGDATFPRQIFLSSYSWRFGGKENDAAGHYCYTADAVEKSDSGDAAVGWRRVFGRQHGADSAALRCRATGAYALSRCG